MKKYDCMQYVPHLSKRATNILEFVIYTNGDKAERGQEFILNSRTLCATLQVRQKGVEKFG